MLFSLSAIFLFGLLSATLCKKLGIPHILGFLLAGLLIGPHSMNMLSPEILAISSDLRTIALIIILLKAGLSLDISDLKKVGQSAFLLSFLPATFEIIAFTFIAPLLLSINHLEAALMGSVLAAVSPAVVVPKMVDLIEHKYGTNKSIPQMILAGSSLDDVYVLVMFSTFLGMIQGKGVNAIAFLNIPLAIILGVVVGVGIGFVLALIFNYLSAKNKSIRDSVKLIIILGIAFALSALETKLKNIIPFASLLAIMSMGLTIQKKGRVTVVRSLSVKFSKLWLAAEIVLFVLVGAAVDIRYTLKAGPLVVLLILLALSVRSLGTLVSISVPRHGKFNLKEKLFCIVSYFPKATVQAAIGSIPLSLGLACGNIILAAAVIGIFITAPLGLFLMNITAEKFLEQDKNALPAE